MLKRKIETVLQVMRYKGQCTLVEVKSTTGNIKSTKTILKNKNVYHVNSAIKLGMASAAAMKR